MRLFLCFRYVWQVAGSEKPSGGGECRSGGVTPHPGTLLPAEAFPGVASGHPASPHHPTPGRSPTATAGH